MIFYDIECFINFFSITLKKNEDIFIYYLFNDNEFNNRTKLNNFIGDDKLCGFNNNNYDKIMFDIFMYNVDITNNVLKEINDILILGEGSTYNKLTTIKNMGLLGNKYYNDRNDQLDLIEMNPLGGSRLGGGLKTYAHYKRMDNIEECPIPFTSIIEKKDIESILHYNLSDVNLTEIMYWDVKPLIDSLDELSREYNIPSLLSMSSGKIVDTFFKNIIPNLNKIGSDLKVDIKQPIDFKIKDEIVLDHLNKLNSILPPTYKLSDQESYNITKDIDEITEASFTRNIKNGKVKFGMGGIHSEIPSMEIFSDDDIVILDIDVTSMYPYIILNNKIAPYYFNEDQKNKFFDIYEELISKRNTLKKKGSPLEQSYKLILNTLTGKFKERYSVLYDPSCHIKIIIYAQYFMYSVVESITNLVDKFIQINTDGLTISINRNNVDKLKSILNSYPLSWKIEELRSFFMKDCNNYISISNDGDVKTKGSAFNLKTLSTPYIIKKSLIDFFKSGIDIEKTILGSNHIFDYCFYSKPRGIITIDDKPYNGKTLRFFKTNNGSVIKSNNKQISNGTNTKLVNKISNDDIYDINYDYYINEAYNLKSLILGNEHTDVVNIFNKYNITLCGKTPILENDILIYKGNGNKGDLLSSYETVGISMIDNPELIYIDIDHLDIKHTEILNLCHLSNTVVSSTDIKNNSFRFFFLNTSELRGRYIWKNSNGEVSFEFWNNVKNKVSISGIKKRDNLTGEVLEKYTIEGTDIKILPDNIIDWILKNPPDKTFNVNNREVVKSNNKIESFDHNNNMKTLFNLMDDKYTKLSVLKGQSVIRYKKPPTWFDFKGNWTETTLTIFPDISSTTFNVYINSFKESFGLEEKQKLLNIIKPHIDYINNGEFMNNGSFVEEVGDIKLVDIINEYTIQQDCYDKLPTVLKDLTKDLYGQRRDVVLLSLLNCMGMFFPNVKTIYWHGNELYNNFYLCVVAGSAMGKSILQKSKRILKPWLNSERSDFLNQLDLYKKLPTKEKKITPPPIEKRYMIAGDQSKSGLIRYISDNDNSSILVFDTEADALVGNTTTEWGNMTTIWRSAFSNESIDKIRTADYSLYVDCPKLNICISGTLNQIENLITKEGFKNGTFSRFMYYNWDGDPVLESPFENSDVSLFDVYGKIYHDFYKKYSRNSEFTLKLNKSQQDYFFSKMKNDYKYIVDWNTNDHASIVMRHQLMAIKLMMTISCIRLVESGVVNCDTNLTISDDDFFNVLDIIDVIIKHSVILFNKYVWLDDDSKLKNSWKIQLMEKLPDEFTLENCIMISKYISPPPSISDIQKWLNKSMGKYIIQNNENYIKIK